MELKLKTLLPTKLPSVIRGFTLIELMLGITILALVAGIAVPNMRTFILNNRLTSTTNEMLRSLQIARSEAMKLRNNVTLCASSNAASTPSTATCATSNLTGWVAFVDYNGNWERESAEEIVGVGTFESGKVFVLADNSQKVSFAATGFAHLPGADADTQTPSSFIVICDQRGNIEQGGRSLARGIEISQTGRVMSTRDTAKIKTALDDAGSSCPPT